ncbi:hypothetical protein LP420_17105 [Massilia sp. B-10]|nr:hypothetical protein LP420_17105 [Massilia sp. B-10]
MAPKPQLQLAPHVLVLLSRSQQMAQLHQLRKQENKHAATITQEVS